MKQRVFSILNQAGQVTATTFNRALQLTKAWGHAAAWLTILLGILTVSPSRAQIQASNNILLGVSTPGGQFSFDVTNVPAGSLYPGSNPTLFLTAGASYRLIIGTSSFHPVVITTNATASPPVNSAYSGAAPQNVNNSAITLALPATNYPPVLYYRCNIHGFFGQINILPPPSPGQIVSLAVTTNVVLVSTGTSNTWVFVPEYSSNLLSQAWSAVPGYTNYFSNGTNTTLFDRLDPICGADVFLRLRQSPP